MKKRRMMTKRELNAAAAADYRAAALRIEQNLDSACCFALQKVSKALFLRANMMRLVFASLPHEPLRLGGHWMCEFGEIGIGGENPDIQGRRVLALCFMATLAEAGDL